VGTYRAGVIHDAELFTIGPDEIVVTFRTDDATAVTTAAGDHEIVTHGPYHSARLTSLEPQTEYRLSVDDAEPTDLLPATVTTLARPSGALLATFATVTTSISAKSNAGGSAHPKSSAQSSARRPEPTHTRT
jgi:hypothetical protein